MLVDYDFCKLADRSEDYSKKWDKNFIIERYGEVPEDFISMWIADLDFELAPPLYNKFKEIVERKTFGYTYDYEEFYEAIKFYLSHKTDRKFNNEEIMLDYSIVNSLYHVVQAFVPKNGKVIINTPVYNPFREASVGNNVKVIENKLEINNENRYEIDYDIFEEQLISEKPDIYILCSPHNPGGKVWQKEELEKITEICSQNDVLLVVDEAHSDHINEVQFTSILSLDEKQLENIVYLNSPNKPFNIAGLKTSFVVIPNESLRAKYQEVLCKNHIDEPNIFGISGLIAAYTPEGMEWIEQSYNYIIGNYNWVEDYIDNNLEDLKYMPLDSTYVLWLDVSQTGMNGDQFTSKLARDTGVLVQEGSSFGKEGSNYVRLNLGTSRKNVEEAFSRIKEWLQ